MESQNESLERNTKHNINFIFSWNIFLDRSIYFFAEKKDETLLLCLFRRLYWPRYIYEWLHPLWIVIEIDALHAFSHNNVLSFSLWTTVPTLHLPKIHKRSNSNGFYCYSCRASDPTDTPFLFSFHFFFLFNWEILPKKWLEIHLTREFNDTHSFDPILAISWCLNSNSIEKWSNG